MRTFLINGVGSNTKLGTIVLDYSQEVFNDSAVLPLVTPELTLAVYSYQYSLTQVQVPPDAIDTVRSLMYSYRPFYNAYNLPQQYDANPKTNAAYLYPGLVAVRNVTTGQVTYIGPDKIQLQVFVNNAAVLFQAATLIETIEGCVPFFASPSDNIEIVHVVTTAGLGLLRLMIANFDIAPYNKNTASPIYLFAT
jgi:hypothetical protein